MSRLYTRVGLCLDYIQGLGYVSIIYKDWVMSRLYTRVGLSRLYTRVGLCLDYIQGTHWVMSDYILDYIQGLGYVSIIYKGWVCLDNLISFFLLMRTHKKTENT